MNKNLTSRTQKCRPVTRLQSNHPELVRLTNVSNDHLSFIFHEYTKSYLHVASEIDPVPFQSNEAQHMMAPPCVQHLSVHGSLAQKEFYSPWVVFFLEK